MVDSSRQAKPRSRKFESEIRDPIHTHFDKQLGDSACGVHGTRSLRMHAAQERSELARLLKEASKSHPRSCAARWTRARCVSTLTGTSGSTIS